MVLFRDRDWSSEQHTIHTRDFTPGQRHSITGAKMNDAASWVAYNLPPGVVLTLVEHAGPGGPGGCSDLKGAGRVVNLVGTGETRAVNLSRCNGEDCISAFYWRRVNPDMGAVELYEHPQFDGNRTILFLAEWPEARLINLKGWYISDRESSARWNTLRDTQTVTLFENPEGGGKAYGNIFGYRRDEGGQGPQGRGLQRLRSPHSDGRPWFPRRRRSPDSISI